MVGRETSEAPGAVGQPLFATTHWSVVLAAGQEETPQSATALEQLCRTYWYPLYAYVRRQGYDVVDAQDLTQGFFAHILSRGFLKRATPAKGKFRSFVLAACRNIHVFEMRTRFYWQIRMLFVRKRTISTGC
jgi:RNA polymerase sigma-70 factor (ECF subfamily)